MAHDRPQSVAALPVSALPDLAQQERGRSDGLRRLARTARGKPLGAISALIILLLVVVAIIGPAISPYDPIKPNGLITRQAPSAAHPFGTDQIGRDILSRVIAGARPSLEVGLLSVAFGTLIGAAFGIVSGYFGGVTDFVIQRVMDAILSIPPLILAIAVAAVLGIGLRNVIIAIAIVITPASARIVRSAALTVRANTYIEAVQAVGASDLRIIWRHILPNVMAPIIVIASIQIGVAILAEAALSFLGLGTQAPNPSWGADLAAARTVVTIAVWVSIFPGLAISIVVLAFNMLGDALRDVLDPRLRGAS
ncbi:MAG TPA: ABC transporter permease [Dehalococcoidia bacterium]|nr:ABC transporter permease [Dehalococcoidia bacterium]